MRINPKCVELTGVIEWKDGEARRVQDCLVKEEPLEIRVNGLPLTVTMRTPGNDVELAAGFLVSEGLLEATPEIVSSESLFRGSTNQPNVVEVALKDAQFDPKPFVRHVSAASACGICGRASIESIRRRDLIRPMTGFRVSPAVLCSLPEKLRASQAIFDRTGGLHAAGLFSAEGHLLVLREDIGRHNAVDKIIGWALLAGRLPLTETVLVVSGRGGFEIIQKALAASIPVVASVSAPSSLAVLLAREFGLTLVGFLRGARFVIYSGEQRCVLAERLEAAV